MLKKKLNKLMAIILIFILTFTNFAFVTESYASSFFDVLLGNNPGSDNVTFKAFFEMENGEEKREKTSSVNNQDLVIRINLSVENTGYLKDGIIEIKENAENPKLNFVIKPIEELPEFVQSIEENVIVLKQITNSENVLELVLPIEYKNNEYFDSRDLSKDVVVSFTGTYVDGNGEENIVTNDESLKLTWSDYREATVTTSLEKFIDYGKGIIVQTKILVDSSVEDVKTLPLERTNLNIKVPEYMGQLPSKITVSANSTKGTNGEDYGEAVFSGDSWSYNEEDSTISINVYNSEKTFVINKYEDDLIQNEEENMEEISGYYNVPGIDEYLITYTYEDAQIVEEATTITSEVEANIYVLSENVQEPFNVVETVEYTLDESIGDIVSLSEEGLTADVSKAYFYINKNIDENKYELEIDSKSIINISYKDIVKNIQIKDIDYLYIDKQGGSISNEDIYYKKISVNIENFKEILGRDGLITVYDNIGNIIGYLGSTEKVTENAENMVQDETQFIETETEYILMINSAHSKLKIETSAPIIEGNLTIRTIKGIQDINKDKLTILNIDHIVNNVEISAKYDYVEDYVDVETANYTVNLIDTQTKPTIELDRTTLKTLELNEDVLLTIRLNNESVESDIYGNSIFIVEFPEYVEGVEVKEIGMINPDGLQIKSQEVEGNKLTIKIEGKQNDINPGTASGGANIQVTLDIKVNEFTPIVSGEIKLKTENEESTNLYNNGETETSVSFSAPTGVISVTNYYNYNSSGEMTSSLISNGENGVLDIYSDAKTVKNEILIMNNNSNVVSNVKILGRIPFVGVKDITNGDTLGTTIDTTLYRAISSDGNDGLFRIFYSEKEDATNELDNESNGWSENSETLDNIKSFLIIPEDEDYVLSAGQQLRFSYDFVIPQGLPHNEFVYSTFVTYYRELSEIATINKTSIPDKIGLTTGVGPEFDIQINPLKDTVRLYEEFQVDVIVRNIGENKAENISVEFPIPRHTKFERLIINNEELTSNYDESNKKIQVNKEELEINGEIQFSVILTVSKTANANQGEYSTISTKVLISAKDLDAVLEAKGRDINLLNAEVRIDFYNSIYNEENLIKNIGDKATYSISARNLKVDDLENAVLKINIPDELKLVKYEAKKYDKNNNEIEELNSNYDQNNKIITVDINRLGSLERAGVSLETEVEGMAAELSQVEIFLTAELTGTNIEKYNMTKKLSNVGRSEIKIVEESSNKPNKFITEGESIEYYYRIVNKGSVMAKNFKIKDIIPDKIKVNKIKYGIGSSQITKNVFSKEDVEIITNILPEQELNVTLYGKVESIGDSTEVNIKNYSVYSSVDTAEDTTDGIEHTIEQSPNRHSSSKNNSSNRNNNSNNSTNNQNNNYVSTYKITGTAWLDDNRDGARNATEKLIRGITVKLIESQTGNLIQTVATDSTGNYTFTGIKDGNYLAIFEFDTDTYTVTAFKKNGVLENMNSDVFLTDIIQEGKTKKGAVTETIVISGGSQSGIDLGLIYAKTFDLKLDKSISKVTVQTINGTETENYNNIKFAKTEIGAKYLAGSTVYVEYEIKVTNIGDIPGYAKKVVDYLPEGMTFNSTLGSNSAWYTGTDGNLYTEQLSNKLLAKGESASFKLVLTRHMTEDNTDIVNNNAEIYEEYNTQGYEDNNSKAGNKAQGENDMSSADIAIMVKTGEIFINVSIISTTLLLLIIVTFMIYSQVVRFKKMRGGV